MANNTFSPSPIIFSTLIGILVAPMMWNPSLAATLEVSTFGAKDDLPIQYGQLSMLTNTQVQPNPDLFADGQIHLVLGAPEITISYDGLSFGPLMASLPNDKSGITYSILNLSRINKPASEHQASFVPVKQIPFERLDIPNSAPGGVGGSLPSAFPVTAPRGPTTSFIFTILGPTNMPSSQNIAPIPLPAAIWFYLTGIIAFGILQQAIRRKGNVPFSHS